ACWTTTCTPERTAGSSPPHGPRSPPRGGPAGALLIGGGAVGPAAAGRAGGDPAGHGAAAERAAGAGIRRDGPRGGPCSAAERAGALASAAAAWVPALVGGPGVNPVIPVLLPSVARLRGYDAVGPAA